MSRDNRGFTLVELLVSIAVLAILSAGILSFVGVGSNLYREVSSEVSLQHEAQLTFNQLREYLVDCNGGIYFDDTGAATDGKPTLYVVNRLQDDSGAGGGTGGAAKKYEVHAFQLNSADHTLNYALGNTANTTPPVLDFFELAAHVDLVDITVTEKPKPNDSVALLRLAFSLSGQSYDTEEYMTFRNPILQGTTSLADLLSAVDGQG